MLRDGGDDKRGGKEGLKKASRQTSWKKGRTKEKLGLVGGEVNRPGRSGRVEGENENITAKYHSGGKGAALFCLVKHWGGIEMKRRKRVQKNNKNRKKRGGNRGEKDEQGRRQSHCYVTSCRRRSKIWDKESDHWRCPWGEGKGSSAKAV